MKKTVKHSGKILLTALLGMSLLLTACTGKEKKTSTDDVTLKYWVRLHSNVANYATNYSETEIAKELQKATNTKIEFIHPPQGQETEKFNIMMASAELPDIISYNWLAYPGGPEKAIKDKVIVDLYDYKKSIPNFADVLKNNEEYRKLSTTDSGQLFSFPFIRDDESLLTSAGLIIRQDWLDELNLEMPQTIEEWENVLTQFKEKKNAKAPLSLQLGHLRLYGVFASPFGMKIDYYIKDGKVVHGILEPGAKEYVALLHDWYEKGLLDSNFITLDKNTIGANILNGTSGVVWGAIGGGIGLWMGSAPDDKFRLEGAPMPVAKRGDTAMFGYSDRPVNQLFTAVTYDSKNKEAAIRFLDYGYGEEGKMLYNFGKEGVSYEMKDGYPTFKEIITNNSEGLSMPIALSKYAQSYDCGPFLQDKRYMEQYAALPEQKRAWETWENTQAADYRMPYLYPTESELSEMAQLDNAVQVYIEEHLTKLIMGEESMNEFDKIIAQLRERGLDRILEIRQGAYERYLEK